MYALPKAAEIVLWIELMGTPRAPAFSQSTSIRYSGTSSNPLGRTFVKVGSVTALPRSRFRAAISSSWPNPPLSNN